MTRISRISLAGAATAALLLAAAVPAQATTHPSWHLLHSDGRTSLRGLAVAGPRTVWAGGTDGTDGVVLRTTDGGRHWSPVGPSGAAGLDFRDPAHGVAVGGDYLDPTASTDPVARTADAGRSWTVGAGTGQYRSGAAWRDGHTVLAVGTSGSDISYDAGRTWTQFDTAAFNAVQCAAGTCWAAGPKGTLARLP